MVVVSVRIRTKQLDKLVDANIELDLLKREDANDFEWEVAQQCELIIRQILEDVKPLCRKFSIVEIK